MRGHSQKSGLLGDYCDGSDFQKHPLYSHEKNALQILLYYDEVEICNPLGTKNATSLVSAQLFLGMCHLVCFECLNLSILPFLFTFCVCVCACMHACVCVCCHTKPHVACFGWHLHICIAYCRHVKLSLLHIL